MKLSKFTKFIITVMVFYAFLASNIFNIGKSLLGDNKDYLATDTQQTTGHSVANEELNFQTICNTTKICEKITFNGDFNDTEKYVYTDRINQILSFIDKNSSGSKVIEDVIVTIEINKDKGDRRGYATRDKIIFNLGSVKSSREFWELSTHEIGHVTDLGYLQWTAARKDKNFTEFGKIVFAINDPSLLFYRLSRNNETIRKAETKKKDFCSGYGMHDPFEDFAECFNLYTNHNSFFKHIARTNSILKKKYNAIAKVFHGQYINTNKQDLTLVQSDTSRRPRDTTKLVNN